VESVLREHPAVAQAAVVGVPDAHWGEAVQAFVVRRQPVDDEALRAWCRERLAGYKCPRAIRFMAELPLSAAGKVLKQPLREMAQAARP
jgi:long-chain acyl-CoA synthetase